MVATWKSQEMGDVRCETPGCGSIYTLKVTRIPARDRDNYVCGRCKEELDSWHTTEVRDYSLKYEPKEPFIKQ